MSRRSLNINVTWADRTNVPLNEGLICPFNLDKIPGSTEHAINYRYSTKLQMLDVNRLAIRLKGCKRTLLNCDGLKSMIFYVPGLVDIGDEGVTSSTV